jgi:hypothetical protein
MLKSPVRCERPTGPPRMIEGAIPKDPHLDYPADARTDAVADRLI